MVEKGKGLARNFNLQVPLNMVSKFKGSRRLFSRNHNYDNSDALAVSKRVEVKLCIINFKTSPLNLLAK